jgi:hypothetical protein
MLSSHSCNFLSHNLLQSTGLPSAHRPEQISIWNRNRCPVVANRQPVIKSLDAFIGAFWKWWDGLNPSWRIRVDGRLKIGGAGSWETLHKPGQNGFLSVLQTLSWWRGMLGVEGTDDWNSAVEDVAWVLKQVLNSQMNTNRKRMRDDTLGSGSGADSAAGCATADSAENSNAFLSRPSKR